MMKELGEMELATNYLDLVLSPILHNLEKTSTWYGKLQKATYERKQEELFNLSFM